MGQGRSVTGVAYPGRGSVFRNIPYGRAGRWEEPRPASWQGALDARESRVSCMQDAGDSSTRTVEDCLNLDVFTPAAAGRRPVLLWFYGGAFVAGAAAGLPAEAAWPLVARQGAVLVVPDTRVGAFGYLGSERARNHSTGNWGTLDQVLALAWVSDNIARFGGDPRRVTIGGWSSGAAAASVLLGSLGESQPLQGAIMSSGGFTDWAAFDMRTAEENYDSLLRAVGCQASPECLREGPACSCLLAVPAEALVGAGGGIGWAPIIDGTVVKRSPMDALRAGKVRQVPIIIGSCLEEGTPALPADAAPADFEGWVRGVAPGADLREALDLYLGAAAPAPDGVHRGRSPAYWAQRRAGGDRGVTCVARSVARAWPREAFQYVWESRFPGEDTAGFGPGFAHESDQRFLFQAEMPAAWLPTARALQQRVGAFLHGRHEELAASWPAGGGRGLIFQDQGPVAAGIRPEQCDFWDGLGSP